MPTFKSGYRTVSVWGGFSMHEQTPLVDIIGSSTSGTHRVIIDNHIQRFVYNIHGELRHLYRKKINTDRTVPNLLLLIRLMKNWDAWNSLHRSQTLNASEMYGDCSKRIYVSKKCIEGIPVELFHILTDLWSILPGSYFCIMVSSSQKHIEIVRKNTGGGTKYWSRLFSVIWLRLYSLLELLWFNLNIIWKGSHRFSHASYACSKI